MKKDVLNEYIFKMLGTHHVLSVTKNKEVDRMRSKGMEKGKITDKLDHTEKSDKNADYNPKEKDQKRR